MKSRRQIIADTLLAFPVLAVIGGGAVAKTVGGGAVDRWTAAQHEIALALARGELTALQWQTEVEALAATIDPLELLAAIRRARLKRIGRGLPTYPAKTSVRFLDADGVPRKLRYAAALFEFRATDVITPHGHRHMASAHMVVDGAFRVRNFDRVRDEGNAIVLRPSRDAIIETGAVSTMSSARDNIHWFVPQGGPAATFDVIVSRLDTGQPAYVIEPVDPVRGTLLTDGTVRAPIIGFRESARFYTSRV